MVKNGRNFIFEEYERYFPTFAKQVVSYWSSGRTCIFVQLEDGRIFEFNQLDKSIRKITPGVDNFHVNLDKIVMTTNKTRGEIAEELGVTQAMMSRYCTGVSVPGADKAYKLAKILGVTVDEFFDEYYLRKGGL